MRRGLLYNYSIPQQVVYEKKGTKVAEHQEMQELQDVIEELLDDGEVQGLVHKIALKHLNRSEPINDAERDALSEDDAYWSTVGLIMTTVLSRIAGRQYYAWDGVLDDPQEFDLDEGCECDGE